MSAIVLPRRAGKWVLLIMLSAALAPTTALAGRPELNAAEKTMLPKYCWGRFVDARYAGLEEYSIPASCGNRMNHLCTAHTYLIAAQRLNISSRDKKYFLTNAVGNFGYTQRNMTPACPLKPQVDIGIRVARQLQGHN